MYKYDKDLGPIPNIGDRVEVCHTASSMDGIRGRIGGWNWGDHQNRMIALVILDDKFKYQNADDSVEVISMPVVCLKPETKEK